MARTRSELLRAAVRIIAVHGTRRASMTDIAAAAGVAKGTLYNHFRTKDDVWSALVDSEFDALVEECRRLPLAAALQHAAERIGSHPALRRISVDEPAVLAELLVPSRHPRAWSAAHGVVADALARAGKDPVATDLVLRWLASHLCGPAAGPAATTAQLLAAALPDLAAGASEPAEARPAG
jgi:AcrR family transcriptional regulator